MKPIPVLLIYALLLSATIVHGQSKTYKCTIRGQVVDRESEALLLFKFTDSRHRDDARTRIPIVSKSFSYDFQFAETEMYILAFEDEWNKGAYDPIYFFPYNGDINFVLYPQKESLRNSICGGNDNKEYYHDYWYPFQSAFVDRSRHLRLLSRELDEKNE